MEHLKQGEYKRFGLTIGGKHTYDDFGLKMTKMYIPFPEPKVNKIDIPYSSGCIDVTSIAGDVNYSDREGLQFEFKAYCKTYADWKRLLHKLASHLHGKKLEMICDDDRNYYYMVRLQLDSTRSNNVTSTIVLSGTADPFKYSRFKAGENWLWDPFNFETGIISKLSDIVVDGSESILISSDSVPTVPTFEVKNSNDLKLIFKGRTYEMPSDKTYYFPQLKIGEEIVSLDFVGSGTVSVIFTGRYI